MDDTQSAWFALRTGTAQSRAAKALAAKGFEVFVPMQQRRRQWSDRVKVYSAPIFKSFVFCRFARKDRVMVMSTPGVSPERDRGGMPVEISAAEIDYLRRISDLPYAAEECDPRVQVGEAVEIKGCAEITGVLAERGPVCKVVIDREFAGRSVALMIPLQELQTRGGGS